eukprot:Protomagalhaensia_sp_Gyna_25__3181@NODE_2903_length_827_cov_3_357868_g2425_i0_p2_GENE_NODE_2903_length_827_cov_3_357868_g2425_i0NODE_2903_length_827_cov_3_357868_g2425_i0_p2_ORF_typecomplete_len171_score28_14Lipoprotein_7/PF01540_16/0_0058DUF2277/PF10041_9/0_026DUF4715/PF15835_5/0_018DUF5314/PF17241_2/0_024GLE1/PF07817_13/0_17DUF5304/PF17230_2/0_17DUF5304/PF17230_2/77DUF1387/PF07139_11/0_046DUF1387/PF07139_11/7e02_NODE_2903_length_827_cov_3_357868_g2425_i093605
MEDNKNLYRFTERRSQDASRMAPKRLLSSRRPGTDKEYEDPVAELEKYKRRKIQDIQRSAEEIQKCFSKAIQLLHQTTDQLITTLTHFSGAKAAVNTNYRQARANIRESTRRGASPEQDRRDSEQSDNSTGEDSSPQPEGENGNMVPSKEPDQSQGNLGDNKDPLADKSQ